MTWGVHHHTHRKKRHMSAVARKRESQRMKGKKHPHKGHRLSAETRAKISKALKGRHHKGHRMSAAARAALSRKMRGRHLSAATRAKISARLKGKKHHHRPKKKHPAKQKRPVHALVRTKSGPRRFKPPPLRHRVRTTRVTHGRRSQWTRRTHGIRQSSTRTPSYGPRPRYKPRKVRRHGRLTRRYDAARQRHNTRRRPRQARRRRRRR